MADPDSKAQPPMEAVTALAEVLERSTEANELVQECAGELSEINSNIKLALDCQEAQPGLRKALRRNENVEELVNGVSRKLVAVNDGLRHEIRARRLLDHQFAAAVEQEEAARHDALHDALTGLPNRALFVDRLAHGLAQAQRHRWTMAVMFIDLDDFKAVNDLHGHKAGDSVLHTIASRLEVSTRSEDSISRFGGDEFLYLLSEIDDEANVKLFAQRLMRTIGEPCAVTGHDGIVSTRVKASIGISLFPKNGVTHEMLIAKADAAMYHAKKSGRGISFAK